MDIPSKYDPQRVEKQWYTYWMEHEYFRSVPDEREPYTVVIPPPNVTGVLHMGHMLNNTIQDVLVRRARMMGKNACWVPGTDHASIATEAKVVAKLRDEGISKDSISREEFLKHAWDWTHNYGGVILEQLKKLGCSCDWERTKFTMDPDMEASVLQVFVDLYKKGLIYRGYRMVNWDPEARTTLSDEEVNYEERQGFLYHIAYPVVGSESRVVIATTRPETLLGDTAVCVHPEDERYLDLHGKRVRVPICDREVPVIPDEYVTMEFGTGCLKVTPAHDENDYALGEKHGLEIVDIFNPDATLNAHGLHYQGMDRFEARKAIVKELEAKGYLVKTEPYTNKVGTSERTRAVIEPRLSDQWFLRMEELAQPALKAVLETRDVRLVPSKFENTYRHWMENIRDWNISRQLWWGQRIPAWYYGPGQADFVVAATPAEALEQAREQSGNPSLQPDDLRQDEDVLDTWFSSWIWPISVFGGILEPENEEVSYYYPTTDLVTGPDILFFWVARMIIAGYEFRGERPFETVYLTGLVRDKQRRKMSKSLGNSPDALELISEFGADGVRVGLLLSAAAGNDLLFDESLCQQGKNFANKIWNAFRLVRGWEVADREQPESAALGVSWYRARFSAVLAEIEDHFSKYRISDALMATYKLLWEDFCSWLLEIVKPAYGEPIDRKTYAEVIGLFEDNLRLLHPFMPFLSEEVWQHIAKRSPREALVVASWPEAPDADPALLAEFEFASGVISGVRTIRKDKNIPFKEALQLHVLDEENQPRKWDVLIRKLANVEEPVYCEQPPEGALSFRVRSNEYFIPLEGAVDVGEEIRKIREELEYTRGFLASVRKKLSNDRFVGNAPEKVVALERKKASDAEAKIETLEKSLANLQ
ncbi:MULTISPECIES: valine--tRNA ligase [Robiginitalea]|uniref:Valine--tRNA ligase n=1 Tax=Robiginitalea biformata (strain ATCC BAA-864 / DSM 15991 / KCTC 12146 / HTCC2501) TaxID=313596 RepID=A4CPB3_ROBBH|nr:MULTISPECIES: valine--tRNA ligase [Robiginitalea]EAR14234.1 valyl-tRNA synthetase [Robiginitalea biformata HTCC2501]MDC6354674.1 valine--tRNA ligase [Robiginitalea sp. PM2]MDC6374644.1 valine--tRNA ligase [Robiginitalea sp. SP8]